MGRGREGKEGNGLSQLPGSLAAKPICLSTFCCLYLFLIKAERNVLLSIFMFVCMFVSYAYSICVCVFVCAHNRERSRLLMSPSVCAYTT